MKSVTGLELYKDNFNNFINTYNVSCTISKITDEQYERVIKPLEDWLIKQKILNTTNKNFEIAITNMDDIDTATNTYKTTDIKIIITNLNKKITISKTLRNIDLFITSLSQDHKVVVQDINSLLLNQKTLGKIILGLEKGVLKINASEYIKVEEQILIKLNTILELINNSTNGEELMEVNNILANDRILSLDIILLQHLDHINNIDNRLNMDNQIASMSKQMEHLLSLIIFSNIMTIGIEDAKNKLRTIINNTIKITEQVIKTEKQHEKEIITGRTRKEHIKCQIQ